MTHRLLSYISFVLNKMHPTRNDSIVCILLYFEKKLYLYSMRIKVYVLGLQQKLCSEYIYIFKEKGFILTGR